jgi:hypothetical protein
MSTVPHGTVSSSARSSSGGPVLSRVGVSPSVHIDLVAFPEGGGIDDPTLRAGPVTLPVRRTTPEGRITDISCLAWDHPVELSFRFLKALTLASRTCPVKLRAG